MRTGEELTGAAPAGPLPAGLVRVRGGELGEAVARAPLVAVRGPAEVPPGALPPPCAAADPELEPWPLRGGFSWRTTWIVRLITCVRTSAAGR